MVTGSFEEEGPQQPPPKAEISLPDDVASHPLLDEKAWIALRDSGIRPLVETELRTTHEARAGFLIGAWLLDRSVKGGLLNNIKPQMLRVVDMLAAGRMKNAIVKPRRSTKTTTLWCVLLGRCWLEEGHFAGYSMLTTQKKTAERFRLDVYGPISRQWPDPNDRPVKLYKGNGSERVEFTNETGDGSVLAILSPDGDAFRSGAYDTLLADEGGAASVEMGEDITSAVLPAFDTRPGGQFIVAGTAAKYRAGNVLWDTLNDPKAGVIRYTVPDDVTEEQLADWEPSDEHPEACVRALIEAIHPGVDSGLTTLEKIEDNYRSLKLRQFAEEYLGLFGEEGGNVGLISQPKWGALGEDGDLPEPPENFVLVMTAHPDGLSGSLSAVWKEADGKYGVGLLKNLPGTRWLGDAALKTARKYRRPIVYDSGSQAVMVEVEALNRATPRPNMLPQVFADVRQGASKLLKAIEEGRLRHWNQEALNDAARIVVKRKAGTSGGWALGRRNEDDDITPVEGISLGIHVIDGDKPRQKLRSHVVTT